MPKLYNIFWTMAGIRGQINAFPIDHAGALALAKKAAKKIAPMTEIVILEATVGDKGNPDNNKSTGPGYKKNYQEKAFLPEYNEEFK